MKSSRIAIAKVFSNDFYKFLIRIRILLKVHGIIRPYHPSVFSNREVKQNLQQQIFFSIIFVIQKCI